MHESQRAAESAAAPAAASITCISRPPGIDASRIGVMGHSLGAYVGLKTALEEPRIEAVVDASGARDAADNIKRMPATLILHGARDKTVPAAKAYRLESLLQKTKTPRQMHIYAGQAHLCSRAAMDDAFQRIGAFLSKYLPVERAIFI